MNDEKEIQQFCKVIEDFYQHAESFQFYLNMDQERIQYEQEAKMAIENEIEKKAAELEVTVDYYIAEFM